MTNIIGKDGMPLGIRGLIKHWMEDIDHCRKANCPPTSMEVAADQLAQTIPVWTRITEDESTWPALWEDVVWYNDKDDDHEITHMNFDVDEMTHWRPLCDIDYPPEDTK